MNSKSWRSFSSIFETSFLTFLEETQFLFVRSRRDSSSVDLPLAQIWQGRWFLPLIKQLVERNFQGRCEPLQGFERGHGVPVLHPRDVAAEQTGALFDITLRKILSSLSFLSRVPMTMWASSHSVIHWSISFFLDFETGI